MTDKVQKIKDWISKEQEGLMDAKGNFEYPEHEGAYHILCNLDVYIDSLQEEPASEDLEEAGKQYLERSSPDRVHQITNAFKAGAQWQKEQFEKNRLAHCDAQTEEEAEREWNFCMRILNYEHRQPTYDDAIKYGMRLQKEQMMANAINTKASLTMSVPSICISLPLGVNVGDKVKVIVIKED